MHMNALWGFYAGSCGTCNEVKLPRYGCYSMHGHRMVTQMGISEIGGYLIGVLLTKDP